MSAIALVGAFALTSCSGSAVEVTIPDDLVAPGTSVSSGDTVRVPGSAYVTRDGSRFLEDVEVGFTLAEVQQQETTLFDRLENPEEFEGYIPVTVSYQVDIPEGAEMDTPSSAGPYGVLSSGEYSQYLDMEGWGNGDVLSEMCWEGGAVENARTRQSCTVLLVPEGESLTDILWDGSAATDLSAEGPYVADPLIFPHPADD